MRQFQHTVTPDDTAVKLGTGDLDVLATPRLILWCESASFQVCQKSVDPDHTTVGTMVKFEHTKGSPVGTEVTIECAEPINDGRRLVCFVRVTDADGDELGGEQRLDLEERVVVQQAVDHLGSGELHRAIVNADRFMTRCRKLS